MISADGGGGWAEGGQWMGAGGEGFVDLTVGGMGVG